MKSNKIKEWLAMDGDINKISGANLKKLSFEDQMIVQLIKDVMEGSNHTAFKTLMELANEIGDNDTVVVDFGIAKKDEI